MLSLSPLNFRGLLATQGIVQIPGVRPEKQRVRRTPIECWRCPECLDVHDDEDDAAECCEHVEMKGGELPTEAQVKPTCPVCGKGAWSFEDASDCCLWKDIDATTRHRMAAAVEAGSTWVEQLGVVHG